MPILSSTKLPSRFPCFLVAQLLRDITISCIFACVTSDEVTDLAARLRGPASYFVKAIASAARRVRRSQRRGVQTPYWLQRQSALQFSLSDHNIDLTPLARVTTFRLR